MSRKELSLSQHASVILMIIGNPLPKIHKMWDVFIKRCLTSTVMPFMKNSKRPSLSRRMAQFDLKVVP